MLESKLLLILIESYKNYLHLTQVIWHGADFNWYCQSIEIKAITTEGHRMFKVSEKIDDMTWYMEGRKKEICLSWILGFQ